MDARSVCRTAAIAVCSLSLMSCDHALDGFAAAPPPAPGDKAPAAVAVPTVTTAAPVSGKTAYWEMYKMARSWATDLVPLSLSPKKVTGYPLESGKYVTWTAAFASPGKKEVRKFTYSVVAVDGVSKGPEADRAMPWAGPTREATPFQMSLIGVDSDAAYEAAHGKAEKWLKEHPKQQEVQMTLGNASRFSSPVWYFIWGNQKSGFNVWINASTGAPIDK